MNSFKMKLRMLWPHLVLLPNNSCSPVFSGADGNTLAHKSKWAELHCAKAEEFYFFDEIEAKPAWK